VAPTLLLVGAALFSGGGNAGALATNERLYRLAPESARVHCQSRFVGSTAAAAGSGSALCATALAIAPPAAWAAYTALYAGAAVSRVVATVRTEVSASWKSPAAPPI
jgi:hypothetical protein